ncbi:hypothetical protein, partial [Halomonas koreensis]
YPRSAAQRLFEKAVARMAQDGRRDEGVSLGQAYCQNRYELDQFMELEGENSQPAIQARLDYKGFVDRLGIDADMYCQVVQTPGGEKVRYRES